MALVLLDRAQETATANTTVSFTLLGASTSYQTLAAVGNTNTTYYGATDGTNWEVGIGTYSTTGPTLTRTTILSSSNAGAAVTFSSTVAVFVDYPSSVSVYQGGPLGTPSSGTVTNLTGTASININGTVGATTPAAGAFTTLSASNTVTLSPANTTVTISPSGTGTVAISPVGALTINPTAVSTINNASIGATTASTGRFTTVTTTTGTITPATGTTTVAPITLVAGTNLTTASAGAVEYDTAETIAYFTGNTTNGRGLIPATQYFRLTANGTNTTTTIAPFFGATSSIPLVTNGVYEIEIECYYTKNTAGTLVWTLTNSAVVTNMTVNILTSPITGYTNVPTASAVTVGALVTQTAAAAAFAATGSLANNVVMWSRFKIVLENAASTSVRLNVTNSAGSITPIRGSFWKATRIANTGALAA